MAWWLLAISYPAWITLGIIAWSGDTYIGVDVAPGPDQRMIITSIRPGGLVSESGAHVGDVLLEVDGVEINEQTWATRGSAGTRFLILDTAEGHFQVDPIIRTAVRLK